MSRIRFRPELFGVLLLTACLTPTDGSGRFGEARVRPQFADGQSPAQRNVHVDSIHTLIRRGDENIVNTVMPYEADAHQAWILELNSVADDVVVTMELMVGRSVAYRGTRNMTVMEGTAGRAPLENVPMSYVGTNIAARVEVQPDAIALSAVGATRQLQAVVYDPDGAVLDKPVSWTSGNAAVATVNEQGLVTAAGGGNTTITATVDGASDTAEVVVDTAIARSSTITADSTSIAANGIANTIVTVRILNRDGQPIGSSAGTVMLTTTLGTLAAVTDHADGTYTATLTAGTTPGTAAITGTLNSNAIADTAFVELRPLAPQPPDPSTTTILADSAAISADATSTTRVTVEVRDVNGNLVGHGGDAVTLATTLGTLSANITDHADGRYTATLTAGIVAGTARITGTLNGQVIGDTALVQLRPLASNPLTTTITADSAAIAADGASATVIRVSVRDAHGNLVPSADTVRLATTLGTLSIVTNHADGTYSATLTAGTTTGVAAITGTLNNAVIADTAFVQLRPLAPRATTTTITADSAAINADSTSTTLVTVAVRDVNGNLVGRGGTVALVTTLGRLSDVTDHADGRYTAILTAGIVAGSARITGTLDGQAIGDTAFVQLRPQAANPLTTTITADSTAIDANGVSSTLIHVFVRDAHGNAVASADTVRLATTLGTLSAVTNHADGTYSAALTAGTATGVAVVTGTLNSAVIADTAFVQLRPLAPRASTTTISADSAAIDADSTSTTLITVEVRDTNGNLVGHGGGAVALVTTLGRLSDVTDHADGRYTAILTAGVVAGTANITGTLNGDAIGDSAFVQLRPLSANPLTTTMTADSAAIDANGVSSTLIHVFVRDAHGNAVASADTVRLVTTLGTLSAVTNHADGTYSAALTAGTATGVAVVTGTLNSAVIADTAFVQLRPLAPHPLTTTITADSAAINADSTSTTLVTVAVRDANGNLVGQGGESIRLITTIGRLSDVIDHADGRYTAILTAGIVAGTANVTGTLNGAVIGDTAHVGFRPLAGTATTTTLVADSTSIAVNGRSTTIVTVTVRDQHGNPVGRSSGTVLLTTTRGILSTITDHGDGTYTATLMADTAATAAPSISDDKPPVLTPDTAIITGTLNGAVIGDTARVEFRIEPVDTLRTTIDADSASLVVGSFTTTIITVTVRDAAGNRVYRSAGEVVLHTTLGRLNLVTDHHNGLYTAVLKVENVAGTAVVNGTLNGNAILDTAAVVFRE